MFLPIGDTPNPKNYIPWVNWFLIAANVGVYVLITLPLSAQPVDPNDPLLVPYLKLFAEHVRSQADIEQILASLSAYDLFVFKYGYRPAEQHITSLFSSLFLHGGIAHLGGNMLFLWIFGDNVEHRLGHVLYAPVYLLTGVAATLAFALFAGESNAPLVGASGAISGVLGLYFLLFRRNKVKVFVFLFPFLINVWLIPARIVLGFFVIIDNLLPFIISAESSVAYGAHLGGFFAGLGIAWLGEKFAWRVPWADARARKKSVPPHADPAERESNAFEEMLSAIEQGEQKKALSALDRLDRRQLAELSPKQCAMLANWLGEHGMISGAHRLLGRCIAAHPDSNDLARVFLELGLLTLERGQPTAAYQHLLSVFDFNPDPETAHRARMALNQIEQMSKRSNRPH